MIVAFGLVSPGDKGIIPVIFAESNEIIPNRFPGVFTVFFLPKIPNGQNKKAIVFEGLVDFFKHFQAKFIGGDMVKRSNRNDGIKRIFFERKISKISGNKLDLRMSFFGDVDELFAIIYSDVVNFFLF